MLWAGADLAGNRLTWIPVNNLGHALLITNNRRPLKTRQKLYGRGPHLWPQLQFIEHQADFQGPNAARGFVFGPSGGRVTLSLGIYQVF